MQITEKTFEYRSDLKKEISKLLLIEPKFHKIIEVVGAPSFIVSDRGFQALFKIIVGQQLSTAAASSIWNKLKCAGVTEPNILLASSDEVLRSLGLSKTKIQYAKGLALSDLDYLKLERDTNEDVINTLVSIKGIGHWTAEIYLMFSLKRIDVFANGDLALQQATKAFLDLKSRPSHAEMTMISKKWKPFRTLAALVLWKYYGYLKNRKDKS